MGKLIVLEGLDGSGKGTQTELLRRRIEENSKNRVRVRVIDFPDYSSEGCTLVNMYLGGKLGENPDDTNAYAASMFFASDRYVSYVRDWKKDFDDENCVIIANRYTTANAYHQLSKLPREEWDAFLDWLWDFEFGRLSLPSPDMVLLLDMPEKVSSALVRKRSVSENRALDIHEKDTSYLVRCREAAAYTAKKCGWHVIPCAEEDAEVPFPVNKIADDVYSAVEELIFGSNRLVEPDVTPSPIPDEAEIRRIFVKWTAKLRLTPAWDISLELLYDKTWRKSGDLKIDCDDRKAVIILNRANPKQENVEEVIVHELMHLKLYPLNQFTENMILSTFKEGTPGYSLAYRSFFESLEPTVEELAKCFLLEFGENRELSFGRCRAMKSFDELYEGLKNLG